MKMIRMALMATALFAGIANTAHGQDSTRQAGRPGGRGMSMIAMIEDSISGLSAEQKTRLDAIDAKYRTKMEEVRAAAGGDRRAMMQEMRPLRQQQNEEIRAVLTTDQQAQLQKLMEAMRARMGAGRPNPSR